MSDIICACMLSQITFLLFRIQAEAAVNFGAPANLLIFSLCLKKMCVPQGVFLLLCKLNKTFSRRMYQNRTAVVCLVVQ